MEVYLAGVLGVHVLVGLVALRGLGGLISFLFLLSGAFREPLLKHGVGAVDAHF